ncbi:hypothetical protein BU14_0797s0002 [Porphyra umbilicalis]|uniref:Uncharacterized protein n=1 Tax=Porphyra umbilicalis TaxID=2786 RepID=A0A1X6NP51_PORUM|nr:hypothetical protein BU14_0797s0002 [Porphyra umbilicalis]|eukprot:OSX70310.1 hypothetical protein BU14_0797s0002 [Porphyra umbilicalis]
MSTLSWHASSVASDTSRWVPPSAAGGQAGHSALAAGMAAAAAQLDAQTASDISAAGTACSAARAAAQTARTCAQSSSCTTLAADLAAAQAAATACAGQSASGAHANVAASALQLADAAWAWTAALAPLQGASSTWVNASVGVAELEALSAGLEPVLAAFPCSDDFGAPLAYDAASAQLTLDDVAAQSAATAMPATWSSFGEPAADAAFAYAFALNAAGEAHVAGAAGPGPTVLPLPAGLAAAGVLHPTDALEAAATFARAAASAPADWSGDLADIASDGALPALYAQGLRAVGADPLLPVLSGEPDLATPLSDVVLTSNALLTAVETAFPYLVAVDIAEELLGSGSLAQQQGVLAAASTLGAGSADAAASQTAARLHLQRMPGAVLGVAPGSVLATAVAGHADAAASTAQGTLASGDVVAAAYLLGSGVVPDGVSYTLPLAHNDSTLPDWVRGVVLGDRAGQLGMPATLPNLDSELHLVRLSAMGALERGLASIPDAAAMRAIDGSPVRPLPTSMPTWAAEVLSKLAKERLPDAVTGVVAQLSAGGLRQHLQALDESCTALNELVSDRFRGVANSGLPAGHAPMTAALTAACSAVTDARAAANSAFPCTGSCDEGYALFSIRSQGAGQVRAFTDKVAAVPAALAAAAHAAHPAVAPAVYDALDGKRGPAEELFAALTTPSPCASCGAEFLPAAQGALTSAHAFAAVLATSRLSSRSSAGEALQAAQWPVHAVSSLFAADPAATADTLARLIAASVLCRDSASCSGPAGHIGAVASVLAANMPLASSTLRPPSQYALAREFLLQSSAALGALEGVSALPAVDMRVALAGAGAGMPAVSAIAVQQAHFVSAAVHSVLQAADALPVRNDMAEATLAASAGWLARNAAFNTTDAAQAVTAALSAMEAAASAPRADTCELLTTTTERLRLVDLHPVEASLECEDRVEAQEFAAVVAAYPVMRGAKEVACAWAEEVLIPQVSAGPLQAAAQGSPALLAAAAAEVNAIDEAVCGASLLCPEVLSAAQYALTGAAFGVAEGQHVVLAWVAIPAAVAASSIDGVPALTFSAAARAALQWIVASSSDAGVPHPLTVALEALAPGVGADDLGNGLLSQWTALQALGDVNWAFERDSVNAVLAAAQGTALWLRMHEVAMPAAQAAMELAVAHPAGANGVASQMAALQAFVDGTGAASSVLSTSVASALVNCDNCATHAVNLALQQALLAAAGAAVSSMESVVGVSYVMQALPAAHFAAAEWAVEHLSDSIVLPHAAMPGAAAAAPDMAALAAALKADTSASPVRAGTVIGSVPLARTLATLDAVAVVAEAAEPLQEAGGAGASTSDEYATALCAAEAAAAALQGVPAPSARVDLSAFLQLPLGAFLALGDVEGWEDCAGVDGAWAVAGAHVRHWTDAPLRAVLVPDETCDAGVCATRIALPEGVCRHAATVGSLDGVSDGSVLPAWLRSIAAGAVPVAFEATHPNGTVVPVSLQLDASDILLAALDAVAPAAGVVDWLDTSVGSLPCGGVIGTPPVTNPTTAAHLETLADHAASFLATRAGGAPSCAAEDVQGTLSRRLTRHVQAHGAAVFAASAAASATCLAELGANSAAQLLQQTAALPGILPDTARAVVEFWASGPGPAAAVREHARRSSAPWATCGTASRPPSPWAAWPRARACWPTWREVPLRQRTPLPPCRRRWSRGAG